MAHQLAPLPYSYDALEPFIDTQTMQLHHDKHHAAYVNNLNGAIEKYADLQSKSVEELVKMLDSVPEDIRATIRNNAGGDVNHTMFWQIMKPNGGGEPTGDLASAIDSTFGTFDTFKQQFNESVSAAAGFG
jgi:Fe-Mn family superoxide dismutase